MGSRQLGGLILRSSSLQPFKSTTAPFYLLSRNASNFRAPTPPQRARSSPNDTDPMQQSMNQLDSLMGNPSSTEQVYGDRRSPGSEFGKEWSPPPKNRGANPFDRMQTSLPRPYEALPEFEDEPEVFPRLNASTGRSIELQPEKGRDIVRGLSMLGALLTRNRVRHDFNKQRFHERPGLKRKRLKSERWRKNFKKGFQQVVSRVSKLTAKGW